MKFTQDFPTTFIEEAQHYLGCSENKKTPNRSACIDEIKSYDGGEITNEPWCAEFVSTVLLKTSLRFATLSPLKRTKSSLEMKSYAESHNIPVDRTPQPGSIFFKYRSGGGHVGIVIEVNGSNFKTIEGNYNDKVDYGKRNLNNEKYYFIHVEEKFRGKNLLVGLSPNYYIGIALGTAGYFLYKKRLI